MHHHHNGEGSGTLLIQTRPNLVLKLVFGKVNCCVPIFQSVAEINRGSKIFLDASLAQAPASFGPKRCFFGNLVPSPSCVPNLKLLASTVAEISRGSQFLLDVPLAQTPSNFGLKCCFLLS